MAGAMSGSVCRDLRPVLAEHLMLGLALPEEAAEHLDHCPDCRREVTEIKDVVRTLQGAALPAATAPNRSEYCAVLPPDLGGKVRQGIADARRVRSRRRRIAAKAAITVTAAAAIVVPIAGFDSSAPAPSPVALARAGQMIPQPWGTEVPVVLTGLHPGQTYRLMTADASGHYDAGGSVRLTQDETIHLNIMTAMRRQTITALLVEDQNGHVVARMSVSTPSTTAST